MVAVNMKRLIISVTLVLFFILFSGCAEIPTNSPTPTPIITPADDILLSVFVLTDQPTDTMNYELMGGIPTEVGVYKFDLKRPEVPGSGAFEKLDVITLQKINNDTYYGSKLIKKIEDDLSIGYPSMEHPKFGNQNFIDGKAVVRINQSKKEVNVTIHFWETLLRID